MTPYQNLQKIRDIKPIIHHITNWVTIYDCAAIVKACNASPVMAHAVEEVEEMAGIAQALVINIGTLTSEIMDAAAKAARAANRKGIPVVFDACGAGATRFRDEKSLELINRTKINIIKGNISEISRIAGFDVRTKGVDAGDVEVSSAQAAGKLALLRACAVVVTGKSDYVTDGTHTYRVDNGCALMADVVGTGCMAASIIGAFAAVNADSAQAAAYGLCCYEIAAELAADAAHGPGTFKEKLFDYVYNLDEAAVNARQKIVIL